MRVLAIETSCDETSAAILSGSEEHPTIESHIVLSQESESKHYGGVVPELVARAHLKSLDGVITRTLEASKHSLSEIDFIAATCGPGLLGGLIIGSLMAKTLALARGIPFVAINHLEGHALSPRLSSLTEERATATPNRQQPSRKTLPQKSPQKSPQDLPQDLPQKSPLDFPYLLLLVSGGHCQLLDIESVGRYRLLGQTLDDSVGECLDKGARLLGLREYNGAALERAAARGDSSRFTRDFTSLPVPMRATANCDFSFSGLKSALARALSGRTLSEQQRFDAAAALQDSVISSLCDRSERAFETIKNRRITHREQQNQKEQPLRFAVAGGVSANRQLCSRLESLASRHGFSFFNPRQELCTDNAAMIAYAALARANPHSNIRPTADTLTSTSGDIDFFVRPRWALEEVAVEQAYVRLPKARVDAYETYG